MNLFVFDIPRLSVAIDPNCMGTESRSAMVEERPRIGAALQAVSSREDCTVRLRPSEHCGGKWSLRYPRRRVPSASEKPEPVLELLEQAERWPGGLICGRGGAAEPLMPIASALGIGLYVGPTSAFDDIKHDLLGTILH